MVSHSALNIDRLCNALGCVFESWWWQTLFQTQAQHLRFLQISFTMWILGKEKHNSLFSWSPILQVWIHLKIVLFALKLSIDLLVLVISNQLYSDTTPYKVSENSLVLQYYPLSTRFLYKVAKSFCHLFTSIFLTQDSFWKGLPVPMTKYYHRFLLLKLDKQPHSHLLVEFCIHM